MEWHRRGLRSPVAAFLVVAGVWRVAAADEVTASVARGAAGAAVAIEVLTPDVRLVVGAEDHRWVLSWPVVLTSAVVVRGDAVALGIQPFVEPQYQPSREAMRVGAGARLLLFSRARDFQAAPVAEVGGLLATDGSGGFVGAGLALGVPEVGITFALVGRAVETVDERRYDVGLDLTIPLSSDEY